MEAITTQAGAPLIKACAMPTVPAVGVVSNVAPLLTTTTNVVYAGLVPWGTLGLTQDSATDGYYQYFTYMVSAIAIQTIPVAAVSTTNYGLPTISGLEGTISIYSNTSPLTQSNNCLLGAYNPCAAVAVVISHGADGYGSYNSVGTSTAINPVPGTYTDELLNASRTYQIVMHDASISTVNPFDDIVLPMTTNDLLSPLYANGTVQPYNAVLKTEFANINAAIAANITRSYTGATSSVPASSTYSMLSTISSASTSYTILAPINGLGLSLPPSITYDPWGHAIQVNNVNSSTGLTCALSNNVILYYLYSSGPDGQLSIPSAPGVATGDSILVPVNFNQLLPILSASGC